MKSDFVVPPLSWDDIYRLAQNVRKQFRLEKTPHFPIIPFIEEVLDQKMGLVNFEVGSAKEMNGAEGLTDPNGKFIRLREDVYESALNGDGRARFTAAHELGHFLMHTRVPLARVEPGKKYKIYRLAEPQANQFAAELLMPRENILRTDTSQHLVLRFGVSNSAADNRLSFMKGKFNN